MRLITIMVVLALVGCDPEPVFVFKIQGGEQLDKVFLESRYNKFKGLAETRGIRLTPNMILRFSSDDNTEVNDSKVYKKEQQLYIDIDEKFINRLNSENPVETIIFQQLSNGLLNKPFTNCGMMWKVETYQDATTRTFETNYDQLFSGGC